MKKWLIILLAACAAGALYNSWQKRHSASAAAAMRAANFKIQPGAISAGASHVLALSAEGDIHGWGSNGSLELGLPGMDKVTIPTQISTGPKWRYIHTGTNAAYAITTRGDLWWRSFDNRRHTIIYYDDRPATATPSPTYDALLPDMRWRKVVEAWRVVVGLDENGALWAWKQDDLPRPSDREPRSTFLFRPAPVVPERAWADFCMTHTTIYAVDADGALWKNKGPAVKEYERTTIDRLKMSNEQPLEMVKLPSTARLKRVVCRENAYHVLALDDEQHLWGFGGNESGELGNGDGDKWTKNQPVKETEVKMLGPMRWRALAVGPACSFGIAIDGSLWGWGSNGSGQLGIGDNDARDIPTLIDKSRVWVAVASGLGFALALTQDGEIYTWGGNNAGTLGDAGAADYRNKPTRVHGNQRWGRSAAEENYAGL